MEMSLLICMPTQEERKGEHDGEEAVSGRSLHILIYRADLFSTLFFCSLLGSLSTKFYKLTNMEKLLCF